MTPAQCTAALLSAGYVKIMAQASGGRWQHGTRYLRAIQRSEAFGAMMRQGKPLGSRMAHEELAALTDAERKLLVATGRSMRKKGER